MGGLPLPAVLLLAQMPGPAHHRVHSRIVRPTAPRWHAGPEKHGGGYAYDQGCRCDECVQAQNQHHRELRALRAQRRPEDNPDLQHGTISTYNNHRCRCPACW
jgi:hypothetical protein